MMTRSLRVVLTERKDRARRGEERRATAETYYYNFDEIALVECQGISSSLSEISRKACFDSCMTSTTFKTLLQGLKTPFISCNTHKLLAS